MKESKGLVDNYFNFAANKTNLKTEIIAGLTTFVTMAYIIIVNPMVLAGSEAGTGMDYGAVLTATCLAAAAATLVMGVVANYPFALAPGMGLNAFFTYTLCGTMGLTWQVALGVVFVSGCLALLITLTRLKEIIIKAIPPTLKAAISAGVGLFITFIGLTNGGIIVANPATILGMGNLASPIIALELVGLLITAVLIIRKVPGNLLIGIIITTILGLFITNPATGGPITSFHPGAYGIIDAMPSLAPVALKLDILGALKLSLIVPFFTLFFIDFFDTIGGFVGIASKGGMIDEEGNLKNGSRALLADSLGTIIGALAGTSNTTTYAESAAGVNAGGRTGMTASVVAICFLLAPFLSPLFLAVPSAATVPALILVGILMCSSLKDINWSDPAKAIPCLLTILMMPLTFSIATGLAFGFMSYVILAVFTGKYREIHWLMYALSVVFIVYFIVSG